MSKSSTATAPKFPPQLTKSAWAKGPPQHTSAPSPRSQSPAPTNSPAPAHPTHSRRPSTLGQGVPIKDGVSVPRSNVGSAKQATAVTFGSIGDVSAPISTSPAAIPPVKSESVKSFGSVAASSSHVNGKSSVSSSRPSLAPSGTTSTTSTPPVSTPSTPSKPHKMDIHKMFQNPSSTPSSHPPSDTASPSVRPSNLPPQPHQQPSQHQPGQPPAPPSQPSQLANHSYTPFVPGGGMRSQQQNPGQGGGPGGGPRSPAYPRQMPNGNASRPPGGPNGPGQPQMSAGLASPRLGSHPHPGQPSGMPPPQMPAQMPIPGWPGYYYQGLPADQHYMQPYGTWYVPPPHPHPQHPQHPQHQHHPQPPGPHGPPHPMSPRNPPLQLQGPGTPTQPAPNSAHSPHPSHTHSHAPSNSIGGGMASPPPTPSTAGPGSARLNTNANAFIPGSRKVTLKHADGTEVKLDEMVKKQSPGMGAGVTPLPPASSPASSATGSGTGNASGNRVSVRIESVDAQQKRLAEEQEKERRQARVKAEAEEKARKEKEEKEMKEKEEAERKKKEEEAEQERIRKEEEDRIRAEEERKEKARKEEEERVRMEEQRKKKEEEERERLRQEEEREKEREREREKERLRREEEEAKERVRKQEEEEARLKAVAEEAEYTTNETEEGEVTEALKEAEARPAEVSELTIEKPREKESLRIDTAAATSPPADLPKKRPGRLDLSSASKGNIPAALPSALATARVIDDLGVIPYPEGVMSPKIELNVNAKDGKFRYDRDFLLQFMSICKEKPDMLPPLDAIGLEPSDQSFPMTRGGSGRHRQGSGSVPPPRQPSVGLGFGPAAGFGKPGAANPFNMGNMGNFATVGAATKLSSEERFRAASASVPASMQFNRPTQMQRTASQGPGGTPLGSNRTRSKRGEKRNDGNKVGGGGGGGQQGHASGFNNGPSMGQGNAPPEAIAPLRQSANRWDRKTVGTVDPDSPEIVDRKVKGLLNKLTMEKFDSISDQIITWANKSEEEKDGRTLIQVIRLVFEKATDEATWSEMYARLCRKMMEQISPKVQDDGIKNAEGKPIAGGQLFRKYLLNRCQEDFERGWVAKEATAAAAATKAMEDQAAKAANEQSKDGETGDEIVLYSEEYYAAQKAKRQGLGLIKFIGELFKLQMLTERIMHECVKKLLGNVENPEEEEIESLCKLLTTVGAILDTNKARAHMDVYFSRMKELTKSTNVSSRMQFMLQDVIELRDRRWVSRNLVAAPTTIAQIHEAAAKEKAAQDKESYQRQMSMSRGGSRRGGDRGDFPQQGPDGWAVAGGSGPPRPPPKAGDLSNFGKISKGTPMTFGPSSVFAGKKDSKRDTPLSRTSSSQNMFSMLSQNSEAAVEAAASKSSRPPSRKASVDFSQTGVPEPPPQRKRLILQPRSKPTVEESAAPPDSESSSEDETGYSGSEMTEEEATKKIQEDLKEFFGVRNLDEAELYFTNLSVQHHFRLVDKLVSSAIESKEADATLVAEFFARAVAKDLCSAAAFEEGFLPIAEMLDDIAIDAPKAFDLMAIMVNGAGLDEGRRANIASKSQDNSEKLLALLS